jgi:hypothetical protein
MRGRPSPQHARLGDDLRVTLALLVGADTLQPVADGAADHSTKSQADLLQMTRSSTV